MSTQQNNDVDKGFVSQYQVEDLIQTSLEPFTPVLVSITEGNPMLDP